MENALREDQGKSAIKDFVKNESFAGILLILVTIIALVWANSKYYNSYHHLWHEIKFGLSLGTWELKANLHHWINDGLMALFFFTIGLEIKREVIAGELSTLKKASWPIAAAIGGMLIPAGIYIFLHFNHPEYIKGWGIPMATDIAFALGLLSLLGDKVNVNLKIFLTALAIAGVHIEGNLFGLLFHPVSIGIIVGLVAGKFIGVVLFSKLMVWLKFVSLPEGIRWKQIYGVGFLAGIGFTMSIFIADMAFKSDELVQIAKVGIFAASFLAAVLGMSILSFGFKSSGADKK